MNNKNRGKEEYLADPWDDGAYRTGALLPPKGSRGLVALLLAVIIILCGVISFLAMMNVRILQMVMDGSLTPTSSLHIAPDAGTEEPGVTDPGPTEQEPTGAAGDRGPNLGITGEQVTTVEQVFGCLPRGLYITDVEPGGSAAAQGVQAGDVLISLDGNSIVSQEALEAHLRECEAGSVVLAEIYRDGEQFRLELTVEGTA